MDLFCRYFFLFCCCFTIILILQRCYSLFSSSSSSLSSFSPFERSIMMNGLWKCVWLHSSFDVFELFQLVFNKRAEMWEEDGDCNLYAFGFSHASTPNTIQINNSIHSFEAIWVHAIPFFILRKTNDTHYYY